MKCVHAFHRKRPTLRLCSIVPDNRVEPKILIPLLKTPKKKPTLCVGFDLYGGEGGIMKCVHAFHRKRPTLRLCSIVPDNRVEPKILIPLLKTPKKSQHCVLALIYMAEREGL